MERSRIRTGGTALDDKTPLDGSMVEAIDKATVLIEALPYIARFHRKLIVIKIGGVPLENQARLDSIAADIVFMEQVGMWPVIVHGGGPRITEALKQAGVESNFVDGHRITDAATLDVARRVLIEELSPSIINALERAGGCGMRLNGYGSRFLVAKKRVVPERPKLDLGFVGDIMHVDTRLGRRLCEGGIIPVVAPIARGTDGNFYNVNADSAAAAIAARFDAEKLVCLVDVPGLLRDPGDPATRISSIRRREIESLLARGTIDGGMVPKVRAGLEALDGGVRKVHIIGGDVPHALLLEIFTDRGIGTEIVA